MEISFPNRLQGKINCHLFKTNHIFSIDLISSWVILVSTLIGQFLRQPVCPMHICIFYCQGNDSCHLHISRTCETLKVLHGIKTLTLNSQGKDTNKGQIDNYPCSIKMLDGFLQNETLNMRRKGHLSISQTLFPHGASRASTSSSISLATCSSMFTFKLVIVWFIRG